MRLDYFDKEEYKEIPLYRMADNKNNLPFFVCQYSAKRLPIELHRHEYIQINYVYQGNMKHVINKHEFEIVKGDIFIIPPYVPHCIIPSQGSIGKIIEFEFVPEFINQNFQSIENIQSFFDFAYLEPFLVSESQVKPKLNLSGEVQLKVENILDEILQESYDKKDGYPLLVKSLLLKLLVLVGREFTQKIEGTETGCLYSRHREAIYAAIEYINKHYNEPLAIEDAAKVAMVSQSYFSYLFKSITSTTFVEYLNGLRIRKAMDLLRDTDNKVLDICYDVGFNNVNHFNRLFRQQTGVSPRIYRKTSK